MNGKPLISIIIATFNRGHLIGETLKSIQNQSYTNWECIIIDDGSDDHTNEAVRPFVEDDERISYIERPSQISKGANACRNYGMQISKGDYLKFFDSDDLMLKDHLKISLEILIANDLDFVVADCRNFDEDGLKERPYKTEKDHVSITAEDFAKFKNGWITNDLLITRPYAEQLQFNEDIRDVASEYQYCIRLLLLTQNGLLIPNILTHRRVHKGSIFEQMTKDDLKWKSLLAENKLFTLYYVEDIAPIKLKQWFIAGVVQYNFDIATSRKWPRYTMSVMKALLRYFSVKSAILYPVAITSGFLFKKGYTLITELRQY